MQRTEHSLLSPSLGSRKTLVSFRYGAAAAQPKVYIQASLHAGELPGMLVAHHLRQMLEQADGEGRIKGEVVLVPAANPIGLAQRLDHAAMGRFEFDTAQNFNRNYPDLASAVFETVRDRLQDDGAVNVQVVRAAVRDWLLAWAPATELDSLRRTLLLLAHDADVVLDMHCDCEAVMHLYAEDACWPTLRPLAWLLGCRAVLIARDSGGGPFDECLSGLWWQLAAQLKAAGVPHALPQGCASTTLEFRGELEVSHELAAADARAVFDYLCHLGAINQAAPDVPAPTCKPTPLSGSQTLNTPVPGLVVFHARVGDLLAEGDLVAEVIDPTATEAASVHRITAGVAGVLYATVKERYAVSGGEIGKIAGAHPFRTGPLLGA